MNNLQGVLNVLNTGGIGTGAKLTHEERFTRAMADLDALEFGDQDKHTGIVWLFFWLKHLFDNSVDWCVDMYTGASFWLHSKFPRGYLFLFFFLGLAGSAIYVYDIYTDFIVAIAMRDSNFQEEFGIVLMLIVAHNLVISVMLGIKLSYHFESNFLEPINRFSFPWDPKLDCVHESLQQQEVDTLLKSLTSSTVQLSSKQPQEGYRVNTQNALLRNLSIAIKALLKALTCLLYVVVLIFVTPFLDISMMCLELLGGGVVVHSKSSITMMAFQNFLIQYETIRVPARSYLESIPQTAYQGYLYSKFRNETEIKLDLDTLIQSIAISVLSSLKNTIQFWIAYKVSGFAFWNYLKNAVQFEGAATLPFRWNAKRSALLDRLVLAGDFYTLAHAQKMKLFQAALQHRKNITITTCESKAVDEECVVVASSLTMLEFICDMLPVSLNESHKSSATINIDITDIKNLPWRDDERTISQERGLKVLYNMHESLMAFINVPMIWPKLEVVRMVNCNLPVFDEEVDYGGLGELLLRSRVKVLEMTQTHLGNRGLKALLFGLVENTSLVRLGLAATGITTNGARQLLQALSGHDALAELDLSLNHLKSEGAQHLARLIVMLPKLQQLHVASIGMNVDGLQALSMQASYAPKLRVLNISSNPAAFATPEAMDLVITLLMRAPHGLHLHVGKCNLDSERVEALCRGGLAGKRCMRGLGLSGDVMSIQCVAAVCDSIWSRVQRDRYAQGLPQLPPYVPHQKRTFLLPATALRFEQERMMRHKATYGGRAWALNSMSYVQDDSTAGSKAGPVWSRFTNRHGRRSELTTRNSGMTDFTEAGEAYTAGDAWTMQSGKVKESAMVFNPIQPLDDEKKDESQKGPRKNIYFSALKRKVVSVTSGIKKHLSNRATQFNEAGRPREDSDLTLSQENSLVYRPGQPLAFKKEADDVDLEELLQPKPSFKPKLNRTYIVVLDLSSCGLRTDDVKELCYVLSEAPGLAVLDLSHNSEVGNGALNAVANLIGGAQKETMRTLRMAGCGLSASGIQMQGVAYGLRHLTELDLSCNPFGDEGIYELCTDLLSGPRFPVLKDLKLASTNIGLRGFDVLLFTLANNRHLQHLDLSNNFIGGFRVFQYEYFQEQNKTLKLLDLQRNELSAEWCDLLKGLTEVGYHRVVLM